MMMDVGKKFPRYFCEFFVLFFTITKQSFWYDSKNRKMGEKLLSDSNFNFELMKQYLNDFYLRTTPNHVRL